MLHFESPLEILQKHPLDLSQLRVFGCTCFVYIQASHRDKLDLRASKCVLLEYSSTKKGYKCYHCPSRRLFISRDVRFKKGILYFDDMNQQATLT